MNINFGSRKEVLLHVEKYMLQMMPTYLKPIDTNWQPSDFLPDSTSESFYQDVKVLRENAKDLSYDLVAVLIGVYRFQIGWHHL